MVKWKCVDGIRPRVKNLYGDGDWSLLSEDRIRLAIVGSRHMTEYGRRVVEKIMPVLVEKEIVIVSGFMYGVDMTAHKSCVGMGGKTVAVLGWGLVTENRHKWIVDNGGLVVSEWRNEETQPWMFAARNRIVAGISKAVLVVEAAENSGSLITANWAKKMGTKLLAVVGPMTSKVSMGTNNLIEKGEAVMVKNVDDILRELDAGRVAHQESDDGKGIKMLLVNEGLTVDEIAKTLKIKVEKLIPELMGMMLGGEIKERDGKYYAN